MTTIFNKLIGVYGHFSALMLSSGALSCKSETASKKNQPIVEKKETNPCASSKTSLTSNPLFQPTAQQPDFIASEEAFDKKSTTYDLKVSEYHDQASSARQLTNLGQENTGPPTFSIKDITIKAGIAQSTLLEVAGITTGYRIKSISVKKIKENKRITTPYEKYFGLDTLKGMEIPDAGLPFSITTDPKIKAGPYELAIKVGQVGKDSKKTEEWIYSMMHVVTEEEKIEKQKRPSRANQVKQDLHSKKIIQTDQNNFLIKDEPDVCQHREADLAQRYTITLEPSFSIKKKNVSLQEGIQKSLILELDGIPAGYLIDSISMKKNKQSCTNKLGLSAFKGAAIPTSGLLFTLPTDRPLQAGSYVFVIEIGKKRKKDKKQPAESVECIIRITEDKLTK